MAYVVDEKGNAKTTLNVVVPTLQDKLAAGVAAISLINGGIMYLPQPPVMLLHPIEMG